MSIVLSALGTLCFFASAGVVSMALICVLQTMDHFCTSIHYPNFCLVCGYRRWSKLLRNPYRREIKILEVVLKKLQKIDPQTDEVKDMVQRCRDRLRNLRDWQPDHQATEDLRKQQVLTEAAAAATRADQVLMGQEFSDLPRVVSSAGPVSTNLPRVAAGDKDFAS